MKRHIWSIEHPRKLLWLDVGFKPFMSFHWYVNRDHVEVRAWPYIGFNFAWHRIK